MVGTGHRKLRRKGDVWADLVCVRDGEDDSVEKFELLDVVLGQIPKNHAAAAQQVGDEQGRE